MPVIGLFANSHLPFEIDRKSKEQPSLAQMTKRALELLSQNEKGFFLMVEGFFILFKILIKYNYY